MAGLVGPFYSVRLEHYYPENEIEGYVEPAGFREVRDEMVHHVGNIAEGINVGKELLRNSRIMFYRYLRDGVLHKRLGKP